MDATKAADGSLLLTYDSRLWAKWLFAGALALAATAAYDLTIGRGDDRLIGLIGATATLVLIGIVMIERTRFHIKPHTRSIEWDRRWAFQRRGGVIPFDQVKSVQIERPIGDQGIPSRRIVLHLRDGTLVPVTVGFRPDVDDTISKTAGTLREILGL